MVVSIAAAVYLGAAVVGKQDFAATHAHRCFVLNANVSKFSRYNVYHAHHRVLTTSNLH